MEVLSPRPTCPRCERPERVCWCAHLPTIEASTRLLIIQHPREEDVAIGTARMASLCLPGSTLVVGLDVQEDRRVRAILDDPSRPAVLLWPSNDAADLAARPPEGPVSLVVLDGTWALAKKLLRLNPRIAALPRYALGVGAPSEYRIRREPREGCLSTIEAIARSLGVLEADPERFAPMLAPFRAMVDTQIACEASPGNGRIRLRLGPRPRRPRPVPALLTAPHRVVVVACEANAWPYDASPRPPDEIVHLAAYRLDGSASFVGYAAPTGPLSPTTAHHARLDAATIRSAAPPSELLARWRGFVRDDDVFCAWGPFARDLLRAARGFLPEAHVDLRAATAAYRGARAGSMASSCQHLGITSAPLGEGRAGERLGSMVALAQYLSEARRARATHGEPLHDDARPGQPLPA